MLFCFLLGLIFLTSTSIQLLFLKFRSSHGLREKLNLAEANPSLLPSVSVVICAKNEAENLKNNLPSILEQDYPAEKWEVIVVDDASVDNSEPILNGFKTQFKHLSIIPIAQNVERDLPGKKYALHQGIANAKFELILLTDADCYPSSDQWVKSFAKAYQISQMPIILGYGGYEKKIGFLNRLIQWETLKTGMQYLGMAAAGLPYMGVGRNLMYKKSSYLNAFQDKSFQKIYASIPSGDDDLLISKIANAENTGFCIDDCAQTISHPATSFKQWFGQKKRHFSTGKYYKPRIKRILGLWELSLGLFWLSWLINCAALIISLSDLKNSSLLIFSTSIFILGLIRISLYWANTAKWQKKLNSKSSLFFYPIGEICFSFFELIFSPYIFWKDKRKWN